MIVRSIIVFIAAAIELWVAVPIGFALGLPVPAICVIVSLGAIVGITLAAFLGDKIRSFILSKRKKEKKEPKESRAYRVWQKYGVAGYGLLAPAITGAVLGSAVGIALGIERRRLILWLSIGAVVWTVGISIAISLGILVVSSF